MELCPITIIMASLTWLYTPLFIYGLNKWRQFKKHFVIQNRFPNESMVVILLIYLLNQINTIQTTMSMMRWTKPNGITERILASIGLGLALFVTTFCYYRAHLIYLAYNKNKKNLIKITENDHTENELSVSKICNFFRSTKNDSKLQNQCSSRCLFYYVLFSSLFVGIATFSDLPDMLVLPCFILSTLIGIAIMIIYIKNGVKDKLGCNVEVWSSIIVVVMSIILINSGLPFPNFLLSQHINVAILALIKTYVPLYIIYRTEG